MRPSLTLSLEKRQVDYVDLEGKTFMPVPGHTLKPKYEFGTMTHFAYRVEGGADGEELVVATTRLETMLGDTVRPHVDVVFWVGVKSASKRAGVPVAFFFFV